MFVVRENVRFVLLGVVVVLVLVVVSVLGAFVGDRGSGVSSSVPTAYPSSTGNPLDYVDPEELDRLIQNPDDEYVMYVHPREFFDKDFSTLEEARQYYLKSDDWDCVDVKVDEKADSLVFTFTQEQRRERLARTIRFAHVTATSLEDAGTVKMKIAPDFREAKLFVNKDSYGKIPLILMWQEGLMEGMAYVQLLSGNSGYVWRVDWVDEVSGRVVMSFDSVSEHRHIMRHCGGGCIETYGGRVDITREYWQSLFEAQD